MNWNGKKGALLGYGIDVQDVEGWLRAQGAELTILNEKEDPNAFKNLSSFDILVRSPGVYRYRDEIIAAEKAGTVVTSKMKIFFDETPTKNIIGVTGTKGKGTTSSLIYQILKAAGKDVYLGGNIGKGIFEDFEKISADSWVVLEMSSFQLVDLHASPHIAVTLMVTSDHLDWHQDLEEYVLAKSAIARFQGPDDISIYNDQYPQSVRIGTLGEGRKITVRRSDWNHEGRLRGDHNRENFAAAAAAARAVGVSEEIIIQVAKAFKGLEHRLEEVRRREGVTFYDDSISTTPDTAMAAIDAFKESMVLILGGSDKGADFTELGKKIASASQVKSIVLLGQTAEKIKEALHNAEAKAVIYEGATTMREAVEQARGAAEKGGVVVLSPACASFGMFQNYKDRGDQFKAAVLS
ncbi:UDP-N-acetylmuramoyl-L-alanine--D-glutamate ligase [bacterium]|nr:UDP-N-acetylmuramoyl-L-alanine--D-glutamate ligase [bacterium]NBX49545.1 UDP-N-acetylmuramoyl-L-alanine--D-glutamate ligase [bacterium]